MGISYRIESMLRLRGMTIGDLERETGLMHASVWNTVHLETRKMSPRISYLRKIANALGCTVGYLIQDREWE